ncbi:MAG: protein TolQ [Alphaproteobacteria bacterium CG_4_9_14_3_um_filter_47_13]|nr:MAG: protein TolQ [Alphaproteobacteria bacterium CG_4_9_14_3_um_filter_47_13]
MTDRAVDAVEVGASFSGDMSMWGLFMEADMIVKIVMMILIFASVWSWTIIFEKRGTLKRLNKRAGKFEEAFWSGESLDKLYQRVKKGKQDPMIKTFCSGMEEWHNGVAGGVPAKESLQASLKQRVERAMSIVINKETNALERGMTFLASVSSTATFIGLFGTVWGIMTSFTAIASTNNTSLAVVAPGIAEALFATALGLVAAIPAVISYNIFTNGLERYADRLDAFTSEFTAILSRHLDTQEGTGKRKVA